MTSAARHPAGTATVRHLHLVDIENLGVAVSGGPVAKGTGVVYRKVATPGRFDQFLVGADASRIFDIDREFPGVRRYAGRGPDGGENAILDDVDPDLLAQRFDALTVGSGDGRFCDIATEVRSQGLHLRVISRPERLSRRLRRLADEFVSFPDPVGWTDHQIGRFQGRDAA